MVEGDKYLDYLDETLEPAAKPWSVLLRAFFEDFELTVRTHIYKDT